MKFDKLLSRNVDDVVWTTRYCKIENEKGETVFELRDVKAPSFWSDTAVNIAASKYFKVINGVPETSVKQLIGRVVNTIGQWGSEHRYFDDDTSKYNFCSELTYILTHQIASFNSPVYFNFGVPGRPHTPSACFLLAVDDNLNSILDWHKTEGLIFTAGSGAGVNVSKLRAKNEPLSKGGISSGPIGFMKSADSQAAIIKSGGTVRRAAKLVCMDVDHPDILDFIKCKSEEEKKARILVDAGYGDGIDGEAYSTVSFQNANHSVRISDSFMSSVLHDKAWSSRYRVSKEPAWTMKAKEILREISTHAWTTGDPGVMFDDTINSWNTCSNSGRINTSNPCNEVHHLDNSSCNLASINLIKFISDDNNFDIESFKYVISIMITAMDIAISNADFPTPEIDRVSKDYRELGLGFSNLGAMLMSLGLPYDSDKARGLAFSLSSLLSGAAYKQSAIIAKEIGPFAGFKTNKEPMLNVLDRHFSYLTNCPDNISSLIDVENYQYILESASLEWVNAISLTEQSGIRNSQISVCAPCGTISFFMDNDTTGIEPDFSLVKTKKMVGGGTIKYINKSVENALKKLGYSNNQYLAIIEYLTNNETIEGAPYIMERHLPVFDCAIQSNMGVRCISPYGHIHMMAAIQPFLSGAISKTCNIPNSSTIEDIENIYIDSWKLGLKSVAVYRDGCKISQPLNTKVVDTQLAKKVVPIKEANAPTRKKLPMERKSITHKMDMAGFEAYLTAGLYEDGSLGELFITSTKTGSTVNFLLDTIAVLTSYAIQYGVPIEVLAEKLINTRSEPSGFTKNPDIPVATSIVDYIFKWLKRKFVDKKEVEKPVEFGAFKLTAHTNGNGGTLVQSVPFLQPFEPIPIKQPLMKSVVMSGMTCKICGSILVQSGTCLTCSLCGQSSGGCG